MFNESLEDHVTHLRTILQTLRKERLYANWYVFNVSIIFYCSMLLYYLFWMFYMHQYAILYYFWDKLINLEPSASFCFFLVFELRRKGIPNRIKLHDDFSWTRRHTGDLECKSEEPRGGSKGGGRAPYLVAPSSVAWRPLQVHWITFVPKIMFPKVSFHLDSIWYFPFLRNTEIGKKTAIWAGPPVSRLVPKMIIMYKKKPINIQNR